MEEEPDSTTGRAGDLCLREDMGNATCIQGGGPSHKPVNLVTLGKEKLSKV